MSDQRPPEITANYLSRLAIVYVRVSTTRQVQERTGSIAQQFSQRDVALRWGWPEARIEICEDDLGFPGVGADQRGGLKRVMHLIGQGLVGIVIGDGISRLGRSTEDREALLALCRANDTLLAIEGVVADLNDPASRLLARRRAGAVECSA